MPRRPRQPATHVGHTTGGAAPVGNPAPGGASGIGPTNPPPIDVTEAPATPPDAPPDLSPRDRLDVARASIITTADIDLAGELWRKYAGEGFGGLWDAEGAN